MDINGIQKQIQIGADARFDETIDLLFEVLLNRHTHKCWEKNCSCEYCRFINGQYVNEKMSMHRLKKRINRLDDYWNASDYELQLLWQLQADQHKQKAKIRLLKNHKKDLQKNIL